jgi:hypothetical protein
MLAAVPRDDPTASGGSSALLRIAPARPPHPNNLPKNIGIGVASERRIVYVVLNPPACDVTICAGGYGAANIVGGAIFLSLCIASACLCLPEIGYGRQAPQAIQIIAVVKPFGTLVIHAPTPPQQSILKELGMPMRH